MIEANYYELLGVTRNAPPEVIRAAYKALAQKYHPDKNPGDPEAAKMMTMLNKAIDTLLDPAKRKAYDTWLDAQDLEPLEDQPQNTTVTPKPVNWYSGWRLLVTSAVSFLAVKLFGFLATIIAFLLFFWLQPKRGTGLAAAAAVVSGLTVAVVASVLLQNTLNKPQTLQSQSSLHPSPDTQPAAKQAAKPNYFDQFDSPGAQSNAAYVARVKALRSAGQAGTIQTIEIRPPAKGDNALGQWPAPDVAKVEAEQTWWITSGFAWMHVANRSRFNMNVLTFKYWPGRCEVAPPTSPNLYDLPLQKPVAPGTEALIRFSTSGVIQAADGCLIVVGILG